MMKIKKVGALLLGVGAMLALSIETASAVVLFSPFTQLNDQDLDFVNDVNHNGVIDQGDQLISVFQIGSTLGIPTGGPALLGQDGGNPGIGNNLVGVADVTVKQVLADGTLVFGATNPNGTAITFYVGSTLDTGPGTDVLNANCGTRAQCIAAATNGTVYFTAGFFGDPDNFWNSQPGTGGTSIATVQGGNSQQSFGVFNFALDIGTNNTGAVLAQNVACSPTAPPIVPCGPGGNGLVQIAGNGQINGGQGLTPAEWTARSKTGAQIAPTLPEPGTLALLAVSAFGLGLFGRRNRA